MGTKRKERGDEEARRHGLHHKSASYYGSYSSRHSEYRSSSSRHGDDRHYHGSSKRHSYSSSRHAGDDRHRSRHSRDEGHLRRETEEGRNPPDSVSRSVEQLREGNVADLKDDRNSGDLKVEMDRDEILEKPDAVAEQPLHSEGQDLQTENQDFGEDVGPSSNAEQREELQENVVQTVVEEEEKEQENSVEEMVQPEVLDASSSEPVQEAQACGDPQPHTPEVQDVKVSPPSGACRIVDEFEKIGRLGEGAYGVVYQARDKRSSEIVAVKKIKMYNEDTEGFPVTSLREINLLMSLRHPSIIGVKEVVINKDMDNVFMVMEYIETSLKDLMAKLKQPLDFGRIKCIMQQLLSGIAYLHDNWVLHRDVKPSNILLSSEGELKLCDFGLARRYDSPIKAYTHNVVTMWYRAPELLTKGPVKYSTAVDVWSLGCIMGELVLNEPLFQGRSEIDQLKKISKVIPKVENPAFLFQTQNRLRERILPPAAAAGRPMLSEKGLDLLSQLLAFDPSKRITARDAMSHAWFQEEPLARQISSAAIDESGGGD